MKPLSVATLLALFAIAAIHAADDKEASKVDKRLAEAGTAFSEIMSAQDRNIPGSILDKAECVVIIPGMVKGGFIVGGQAGKGAVTCRNAAKDAWGAPAMIEMGGGSFGLQIGATATDVVMLVMNRKGMNSLLKDKFTLGGDASVAAGPVGRGTTAETDAALHAEILSYSRSKGAFAGLALKGTTLTQDDDANEALYGKKMDASQILSGTTPVPAGATPMLNALKMYSPTGK
jgi:lipid-binding SYLF domain-containing protein